MGPIWGRQDPGGPHVSPMNFAICSVRLLSLPRRNAGSVQFFPQCLYSLKIHRLMGTGIPVINLTRSKTVWRLSQFYNDTPNTNKTVSSQWIETQVQSWVMDLFQWFFKKVLVYQIPVFAAGSYYCVGLLHPKVVVHNWDRTLHGFCTTYRYNVSSKKLSVLSCYIDGVVQDCSNSIANARELRQYWTKPLL